MQKFRDSSKSGNNSRAGKDSKSVNHSPESTDTQKKQKIELIKGHFNTEEEEAEILPHGMVKVPRKFRGSVSS